MKFSAETIAAAEQVLGVSYTATERALTNASVLRPWRTSSASRRAASAMVETRRLAPPGCRPSYPSAPSRRQKGSWFGLGGQA